MGLPGSPPRRGSAGIGRFAAALSLLLVGAMPARAADEWQAGAGADWQALLAKAKAERVVVVAMGAPIGKELAAAFLRDTGLELQFVSGDSSAISARFAQEAASPNLSIDVHIGGSSELPLIARGLMQPLKPLLKLPQVTDGRYWREGDIRWIDNDGEYFAQGAEYLSFRVFANADKVRLADLHEFADLLQPKYKGKIASSDPTGSAGGRGFAEAIVSWRGGAFLERFYKGQDIVYTKNPVQLVEWAARGTYPIIIGSLQQYVDKFTSEGFNIQYVGFDDWPIYSTGGRSVVKIAAKAPHPAAAAVFANWYLSKPGQELYEALLNEPSRRTDLAHKGVPGYVLPKEGVHYVGSYDEDYVSKLRGEVGKQMRILVAE
jgi:ABC-type Fe3+ transport system substrate-binding protein